MISRFRFFTLFCFPASHILTILSYCPLPSQISPPSVLFLLCVSSSFSLSSQPLPPAAQAKGGGAGGWGKKGKEWERREARVSNIGRVHFSLPQITAIKQPGQMLSHQFDSKHWEPLDKPADLHLHRTGRGAEDRKKKGPRPLNCHLI